MGKTARIDLKIVILSAFRSYASVVSVTPRQLCRDDVMIRCVERGLPMHGV
jgi:hypothetical protein